MFPNGQWVGRQGLIGNQTVICLKKITAVFTFVISLPNRSLIFYVNEQILESHRSSVSFNTLFSQTSPQKHSSHPCWDVEDDSACFWQGICIQMWFKDPSLSNQFNLKPHMNIGATTLNTLWQNSTQIGLSKEEMYSLLLQRSPEISCFRQCLNLDLTQCQQKSIFQLCLLLSCWYSKIFLQGKPTAPGFHSTRLAMPGNRGLPSFPQLQLKSQSWCSLD